jgi:class 3 adenylate cyclase
MNEDRGGRGDAGTWGATRHANVPTGLRAILGAPVEKPCQGKPAIRAALDMPDAVRSLRLGWQVAGRPAIRIGSRSTTVLVENGLFVQRLEDP